MLEIFLVNIFFIILPVLLLVVFFENTEMKYQRMIFMIFSTISMVLCMNYPFILESGVIYDLRYTPFVLIALYGGYKGVFPLYILLNIQRLIIGEEGSFQSILFSTGIFILLPLMSKRFKEFQPEKRIMIGVYSTVIVVIVYFFTLSIYLEKLTAEFWTLAFYALIIQASVMLVNLILIEKVISNNQNRENNIWTEQLHVMGELSASVSHELRNPLTVAKGFLQLLANSKTSTNEEKLYIEHSLKEVMIAETILNDYLTFAKPQLEHMVYSDLKQEIEYVQDVLVPIAAMYNVEIRCHFSNSLKKEYDQNQMKQCLLNLLKNAITSMKNEGGILSISVMEEEKNIVIRIEDTGIGMTKEEIYQLGKPIYSYQKDGTGLGMLMVYGTIVKLNGNIDVQSKVGEGTTFTIIIPT
ncbi:HAMP domain-containing sensor histidine kinase [Psychrobacillus sp. OK032]|uniref:sensor histidine kinase n=1 Tax=Psychrobacillus sp. OK032 TaxID=1884358 RepID=UPI0008C0C661|nr:HAMP domain-containing sensor histidine kinase [Psychrobacillus sp. OK032]SER78967.1 two-component system, sporulation sensor kinase B [Psychrobacillus sp. OK032]